MMAKTNRLENADSREFWKAASEGRLLLQRCRACSVTHFPPRNHCVNCWHGELEWREASGFGTVESMTVVHRAAIPAFRSRTPYIVAAILLEEGPRMITNLVGDGAIGAELGDPVKVVFVPEESGETLAQFQLVDRAVVVKPVRE